MATQCAVRRLAAAFLAILSISLPSAAAPQEWTFIELGTLGGRTSTAEAVSNSGIIAGWSELTRDGIGDRFQAFLWRSGGLHAIGEPVTHASPVSRAFDVNNRGDAVGTHLATGAVVFKASGETVSLGVDGAGFGINDAGTVVGEYYGSGPQARAFLYRKGARSAARAPRPSP